MTNEPPGQDQSVFDALADPDCRRILTRLDDPLSAKEVATQCDLSQTSTYRKLELLSDAGLVDERVRIRSDGHHVTCYGRDFDAVLVAVESDQSVEVDVVSEPESADERLARFWSQISDEL